jgi:hypothetical protein
MPHATAADLLGKEFPRCIMGTYGTQQSEHLVYLGTGTPELSQFHERSSTAGPGNGFYQDRRKNPAFIDKAAGLLINWS